jgi:RNA polymerase sigma-70 factor (ECF subfamily)
MEQCISAPDDTESRIDNMVLRDALNGFLGTLNEQKRNVFIRRYVYLDSIDMIAVRFACSQNRVKTMLFRTRVQLRKYLEKEGYDL